jgi:hypothetical protein
MSLSIKGESTTSVPGLPNNKNPKNTPNYKDGRSLIIKYCLDCNKIINYRNTRCKKCYLKYNTGKNNSNYKNGRWSDNPIKCVNCKKPISIGHIRCKSCARIGKLHPNYIRGDGYAPYALEFNPKLREQIRNRDGNKCKRCGMTKQKHYKKYHRNLEVHHKDHNRMNCNPKNLETLCKKCNNGDNKIFRERIKNGKIK